MIISITHKCSKMQSIIFINLFVNFINPNEYNFNISSMYNIIVKKLFIVCNDDSSKIPSKQTHIISIKTTKSKIYSTIFFLNNKII